MGSVINCHPTNSLIQAYQKRYKSPHKILLSYLYPLFSYPKRIIFVIDHI